jgi:hypothetical protein
MSGYEIVSLDELGHYPSEHRDDSVLIPVRRALGLTAFGANCWTAEVGRQIVPRHDEDSGNEELYAVIRGRARFIVDDETFDAPAGTLVHVLSGETRQAFAEEPDTLVLAVGGTIGEPFTVYDWEATVIAYADARRGNPEGGKALMRDRVEQHPDAWWTSYNVGCFEALFGDPEEAFVWLLKAREMAPGDVAELAVEDPDLVSLHGDPRWQEVVA